MAVSCVNEEKDLERRQTQKRSAKSAVAGAPSAKRMATALGVLPMALEKGADVEMSDAPASAPTKAGPDMYARMKSLQRQLEFLEIQEEYIKDEMGNLKRELVRAKEEIKRIQSVPLVIGQFLEIIDHNHGIVSSTTGSNYYVRILSTINRELLKPSSSVALHRHSNAVVDVLPPEADSSISLVAEHERPEVSYSDIGAPAPSPLRANPATALSCARSHGGGAGLGSVATLGRWRRRACAPAPVRLTCRPRRHPAAPCRPLEA